MAGLAEGRGGAAGPARGLLDFLRRIWLRRELLHELVRRELQDAYAGSVLARAWAVLHPLLLTLLYLFVFGYVFQARGVLPFPAGTDFAVFVLPGLACWLTVQAAITRASTSLTSARNLVKQVVFPIELLPIRSVLAAQLPMLIGLGFVLIYAALRHGEISPLLPLLALAWLAQTALLAGLALLVAVATAFLRDIRDIVQFVLTVGLFLTPAIYLPGSIPAWFEALLWLNPFSHAIWVLQDIVFFQAIRHPFSWLLLPAFGFGALWLGARVYSMGQPRFGDVL
jgi:lipopolysaccharide transport system permease protein